MEVAEAKTLEERQRRLVSVIGDMGTSLFSSWA